MNQNYELVFNDDGTIDRYNLVCQHASSNKYGKCEICGERVSDVYSQSRERLCSIGDGREHWCYETSTFGHKDCLINLR